jgi:hypothetical protein
MRSVPVELSISEPTGSVVLHAEAPFAGTGV